MILTTGERDQECIDTLKDVTTNTKSSDTGQESPLLGLLVIWLRSSTKAFPSPRSEDEHWRRQLLMNLYPDFKMLGERPIGLQSNVSIKKAFTAFVASAVATGS